MKRLIRTMMVLTLAIVVTETTGRASETQHKSQPPAAAQYDPMYMGKPLSYWLKAIEDRDIENLDLAFDAIAELGPDAWPAVPRLTRIVAEPFAPIQVGVDDYRSIKSKLRDIDLRAGAVDSLAAIGEAASSSTVPLIRWALADRVIPETTSTVSALGDELFVDLVALDVLQRMRVAGAIAAFGPDAVPAVTGLLAAPDGESRKLAVAILGEKAPAIAAALFKSRTCERRKLGVAMLMDMWPVMAREHLVTLKSMLLCADAN